MSANDYAIIVGITNYPRLKDLNGPENDARGFQDWLISADGGSVPVENITLIVSSEHFDSQETDPAKILPSTVQIDAAFEGLIDKALTTGGRLGRRLYIYMAGHGFSNQIEIEETAVLMANASRVSTGHHIPVVRYANWFRSAAYFEEIVLLVDACRDEFQLPQLRFPPWKPQNSAGAADVRFFYAFAARTGRKARERAFSDDGPIEGVFTHAVLTALRKTPRDEHGRVSGSKLRDYIFNVLKTLVPGEEPPNPEIRVEPERDIIFIETQAEKTIVRIKFSDPNPAHTAFILDYDFKQVERLDGLKPAWEVSLVSGFYRLIIRETDAVLRINVTGEEELDVTL